MSKLKTILTRERVNLALNEEEAGVQTPAEVFVTDMPRPSCNGGLIAFTDQQRGPKYLHQCNGCGEPYLMSKIYPNTTLKKVTMQ
jgi:hypothetical protein